METIPQKYASQFRRFVSLQIIAGMIISLAGPFAPAVLAAPVAKTKPAPSALPPSSASAEPVDWSAVDWDSAIVTIADQEKFVSARQALAEQGKAAEAKALEPAQTLLSDDALMKKSGVPEAAQILVRNYREAIKDLGADKASAARHSAEREYLKNALRVLFPSIAKQDKLPKDQVIDFRAAPRLHPRSAQGVKILNVKPTVKVINQTTAPQSAQILRGATVRQLRALKQKDYSLPADTKPVSVQNSGILRAFFDSLFSIPAANAATPIIAYSNGIEKKPLDYALYYLANQQNPDGSFGIVDPYINTMAALELLVDTNRTNNDQYTSALNYLQQTAPANNREIATQARLLFGIGKAPSANILLDGLMPSQNSDGGFGVLPGYQSDLDSTLAAALAMAAGNYSMNDKFPKTMVFVVNHIPDSGELRYTADSNPNYYLINQTAQQLAPFAGLTVSDGQNQVTVQSKIDALLNYLRFQYDPAEQKLLGADAADNIMTLETWRLYGVEKPSAAVLEKIVLESQFGDGSFADSFPMAAHAIYALAAPDIIITNAAPDNNLVNYSAAGFSLTIINNGYATLATSTLYLFVDNVETGQNINLQDDQITILPNQTLQLRVTYPDTPGWIGDTELRWYLEGERDLNYDDNWLVKNFAVASEANGKPALPGYFSVFKYDYDGMPAIIAGIPASKTDPNRKGYGLLFRPKGLPDWEYMPYDPKYVIIAGFPEGAEYEFTIGVIDLGGAIRYYDQPVTVKFSADSSKYNGALEGRITLDNAGHSGLSFFVQGQDTSRPDENGDWFSTTSPNGRVAAWSLDKMNQELRSTFDVAPGATTTPARIFTHLKEDAAAPVIAGFEIRFKQNFIVKNQKEVDLYAWGSDNVALKEADFYLWNPADSAWSFLGTQAIPDSTALFKWYVPADLLGENYKVKAIFWDYRGNQSLAKEWGPFKIIDGTAPTFTVTAPAAGLPWELGKPQTIAWTTSSTNPVNFVNIVLRYSPVATEFLAANTANSGTMVWTVPTSSWYAGKNVTLEISGTDSGNFETGTSVSAPFDILDTLANPPAPWGAPEVWLNDQENRSVYLSKSEVAISSDSAGSDHLVYKVTADNNFASPRVITEQLWYRQKTDGFWSQAIKIYETVLATDNNLTGYAPINSLAMALNSAHVPSLVWKKGSSGSCLDYNSTEIFFASLNKQTGQLDAPLNISNNVSDSQAPQISASQSGSVQTAWLDGRVWDDQCSVTGTLTVRYRELTDNVWSGVEQIGNNVPLYNPRLATLGSVVYLGYNNDQSVVSLARREAGVWGTPVNLLAPGGSLQDFNFAAGINNDLHLAMTLFSYDPNLKKYYNQISYRTFANGVFGPAEAVATTVPGTNDSLYRPLIAVDQNGVPHVLYEHYYNPGGRFEPRYTARWPLGSWAASQPAARASNNVSGHHLGFSYQPVSRQLTAAWLDGYARADEVFVNNAAPPSATAIIYEDAEDGDTVGWKLYAPGFSGTYSIANVADDKAHGRALEVKTSYIENDYWLKNPDGSNWNDTVSKYLQWDVKTSREFYALVHVETNLGPRHLQYSSKYPNKVLGSYIYLNLSPSLKDGSWHTLTRDLQADAALLVPGIVITKINSFSVSGYSARFDNIIGLK
ncbi:MAG: hypothetical protein Q7K39_00705 [Candidatus Magasanikbacteria bacterium]|nr:hypothetical protein [Candidatus Magasanikbacteria bacterium]